MVEECYGFRWGERNLHRPYRDRQRVNQCTEHCSGNLEDGPINHVRKFELGRRKRRQPTPEFCEPNNETVGGWPGQVPVLGGQYPKPALNITKHNVYWLLTVLSRQNSNYVVHAGSGFDDGCRNHPPSGPALRSCARYLTEYHWTSHQYRRV